MLGLIIWIHGDEVQHDVILESTRIVDLFLKIASSLLRPSSIGDARPLDYLMVLPFPIEGWY